MGVFLEPTLHFSLPGVARSVKKLWPAAKCGQQRKNRKKAARWALKGRQIEKHIFFEKVRIFAHFFRSLMRGTARQRGFLHVGPHFVAKGVLGHMGQIHPISTGTQGKLAIFFRSMGFPCGQRWIGCRWSPQYRWAPPEHPRDTSHTFSASCCRLPIRPVAIKSLTIFLNITGI